MTLLDRHIGFIEALREAGMSVSLTEDLDSVRAATMVTLTDREALRSAFAATLLKRQSQRHNFDAIFDLFYPPMIGAGVRAEAQAQTAPDDQRPLTDPEVVADFRQDLVDAMAGEDAQSLEQLAVQAVERYGAMPGRPEGMSAWSSYNTMQRLSPDGLVLRLAEALIEGSDDREPRSENLAMVHAANQVERLRALVESDVRRRIAEDRTPDYVARTTLRPSTDQIAFTSARRSDIEEMRRQLYPLARRLATRMTKQQHARRRGPLDFRRTIRASMATGGVPVETFHRPKRPHRTELVVLCDVSGSVASFASFTLLLVYALREQFTKVRAFTFVDEIHEVTGDFVPGADPADTMARLAESARNAALWGRTNYGRSLNRFWELHSDSLGPKTNLLVLGDARSNYSDPGIEVLRRMTDASRHSWWLNPEHRRQWDTGDSAASAYAEVIDMVECRNLTQLTQFVSDLV